MGRSPEMNKQGQGKVWLRGLDLNQRPLGYEPNELPDCSTPRKHYSVTLVRLTTMKAHAALLRETIDLISRMASGYQTGILSRMPDVLPPRAA